MPPLPDQGATTLEYQIKILTKGEQGSGPAMQDPGQAANHAGPVLVVRSSSWTGIR